MLGFRSGRKHFLYQHYLLIICFFSDKDSGGAEKRKRHDTIQMLQEKETVALRNRGPSLKIRSSTLSMLSLSNLSMSSEFEDDINCTKQLTVLKIIILDIFFSLADHLTDFLQVIKFQNYFLSELFL